MFDFLGPFSLIVFFLIGIVIGVMIFPLKWLKANSLLQTAGISLTLFSMGASMAGSPTFLADLRAAGLRVGVYPVSEHCWMDMGQMEELDAMRRRMENT